MFPVLKNFAAGAALACLLPAGAMAATLDFEDLTGVDWMPATYGGFSFAGAPNDVGAWFSNDDPAFAHSPITSLSTGAGVDANGDAWFGDSAAISSSTPFVLQGAWFTAYADNIGVRLRLSYQGVLVHESLYLVTDLGVPAAFLPSGYSGAVDSFVVEGYQGYFAMDDVVFAPVPEPGTYALMLLGLGAIGAYAWRRGKQD